MTLVILFVEGDGEVVCDSKTKSFVVVRTVVDVQSISTGTIKDKDGGDDDPTGGHDIVISDDVVVADASGTELKDRLQRSFRVESFLRD